MVTSALWRKATFFGPFRYKVVHGDPHACGSPIMIFLDLHLS